MRDLRQPEEEDGDDFEAGEVGDPVATAPDLLEEGEGEVRLFVEGGGCGAVVAEEDNADDAEDDYDGAGDVGAGYGGSDEEVGAGEGRRG